MITMTIGTRQRVYIDTVPTHYVVVWWLLSAIPIAFFFGLSWFESNLKALKHMGPFTMLSESSSVALSEETRKVERDLTLVVIFGGFPFRVISHPQIGS